VRLLRKDAKIELLRSAPLFSRCSARELGVLASLTVELAHPSGKDLIREGVPGHEFVVILDGAADVIRCGRLVARLGPGDFAGEISLLSQAPRTATVRTSAPTRVLVLAERDFRSFVQQSPSVAFKLLEALAERIPETLREGATELKHAARDATPQAKRAARART